MRLLLTSLSGVVALAISSGAAAQDQPQQSTTTRSTTTAVPATPATPAQTQTTTTQTTTTTPTDPATGEATGPAQSSTTTATTTATGAATAADVKAGVKVYDSAGAEIGTIASATSTNAVISTGKVRATIALSSFAKSDKGLVLGMTKAEFDAAAAKAKK